MKNGKKKNRIVLWFCVVLAVWVIAGGGYAKRDVFYLMGSEHSTFKRNDCDVPAFGIRFRKKALPSSVLWLDAGKCEVLWKKILNGYVGSNPDESDDIRVYGNLYAYAKWADRLGMKTIFRPLQPWMEVVYVPAKSLLYISQDCDELGWEFSEGLVVSGVSPELLGIDIEVLVRDLEKRKSIEKKRYEPLLKMISDKKNESGGENKE